ncbi:MAG: ABC transporter ATP-binding protein [Planctomycetota bacterium]|jgi:predicted ABC-type transport system involved in lysophospholipase L1 biosynthesis ATPase subunit|nr:ABC transporter ATP-binding protein [Planctomycetota bacterium]
MPELALEATGLHKTYHDGEGRLAVLRGVDINLAVGESMALVGRSGSGKSTLLNLLGLLDRPDAGEIRVGGTATEKLGESGRNRLRGREIGFVFQNYHLLGDFTVEENVMLGAAVGGGGGFRATNRARAREWLDRLGLISRAGQRPFRLSGGEQQRVAIARAMLASPKVMLCDEPTGNLDAATGREVADWLWRACRETGMAMLLVTHEMALADRADRVFGIADGELSLLRPPAGTNN